MMRAIFAGLVLIRMHAVAAAAPSAPSAPWPPSSADVVELAVGATHSCAAHVDGAVSCWGANDHGQLGDGTTTPSAVPIRVRGLDDAVGVATDGDRTCARRRDGTVSCWGVIALLENNAQFAQSRS